MPIRIDESFKDFMKFILRFKIKFEKYFFKKAIYNEKSTVSLNYIYLGKLGSRNNIN